MTSRSVRLQKLEATLKRLRDVIGRRIATLEREGEELRDKRKAIETLLARDERFLDITLGGAVKRLQAIDARLIAIGDETKRLRKRAADAVLKAGRMRDVATEAKREDDRHRARASLTELADRHVVASLRQADDV